MTGDGEEREEDDHGAGIEIEVPFFDHRPNAPGAVRPNRGVGQWVISDGSSRSALAAASARR